jgi:hypothetical protein
MLASSPCQLTENPFFSIQKLLLRSHFGSSQAKRQLFIASCLPSSLVSGVAPWRKHRQRHSDDDSWKFGDPWCSWVPSGSATRAATKDQHSREGHRRSRSRRQKGICCISATGNSPNISSRRSHKPWLMGLARPPLVPRPIGK